MSLGDREYWLQTVSSRCQSWRIKSVHEPVPFGVRPKVFCSLFTVGSGESEEDMVPLLDVVDSFCFS